MNLAKSLSIPESDKYLLDFLKEEALIGVCFSLVLCSTTHCRVQLLLGIRQGGNPFALAETWIHYQYTRIKCGIPNRCYFLVLVPENLTVVKTLLSTQFLAPIK